MLKVIEHTASPSLSQRAQLHAVDCIDRNLETAKKVLLVLTYVGAVATVALLFLRVF